MLAAAKAGLNACKHGLAHAHAGCHLCLRQARIFSGFQQSGQRRELIIQCVIGLFELGADGASLGSRGLGVEGDGFEGVFCCFSHGKPLSYAYWQSAILFVGLSASS